MTASTASFPQVTRILVISASDAGQTANTGEIPLILFSRSVVGSWTSLVLGCEVSKLGQRKFFKVISHLRCQILLLCMSFLLGLHL